MGDPEDGGGKADVDEDEIFIDMHVCM